jgi:hypothetical protein
VSKYLKQTPYTEEKFILPHGFKGFSLWWTNSIICGGQDRTTWEAKHSAAKLLTL